MSADRHVHSRRMVLVTLAFVGAAAVPFAGSGPASAAAPARAGHRPSTVVGGPGPAVTGPVRSTSAVGSRRPPADRTADEPRDHAMEEEDDQQAGDHPQQPVHLPGHAAHHRTGAPLALESDAGWSW
mgnify:CR=1 FL=1